MATLNKNHPPRRDENRIAHKPVRVRSSAAEGNYVVILIRKDAEFDIAEISRCFLEKAKAEIPENGLPKVRIRYGAMLRENGEYHSQIVLSVKRDEKYPIVSYPWAIGFLQSAYGDVRKLIRYA